jgi:hypothetical protein
VAPRASGALAGTISTSSVCSSVCTVSSKRLRHADEQAERAALVERAAQPHLRVGRRRGQRGADARQPLLALRRRLGVHLHRLARLDAVAARQNRAGRRAPQRNVGSRLHEPEQRVEALLVGGRRSPRSSAARVRSSAATRAASTSRCSSWSSAQKRSHCCGVSEISAPPLAPSSTSYQAPRRASARASSTALRRECCVSAARAGGRAT